MALYRPTGPMPEFIICSSGPEELLSPWLSKSLGVGHTQKAGHKGALISQFDGFSEFSCQTTIMLHMGWAKKRLFSHLARLKLDGSIDSSFAAQSEGFNGPVYSLTLNRVHQKIYVGGDFTSYFGTIQNYLTKLNFDGSLSL